MCNPHNNTKKGEIVKIMLDLFKKTSVAMKSSIKTFIGNIDLVLLFGKSFYDAVTASNPPPIQPKLEKVHGALLL